ncbi:hypothetical protein TNCV_244251 [Trichonephila clavipes]|uniref:Uncharacterized protein n=1 Tax=Trichonephila clavipes TaxID=2585209 RepID=A0A8X6RKK1_TRICX|nr:hypothetical protein TNCV_244251 [Trichonephila clavipes]
MSSSFSSTFSLTVLAVKVSACGTWNGLHGQVFRPAKEGGAELSVGQKEGFVTLQNVPWSSDVNHHSSKGLEVQKFYIALGFRLSIDAQSRFCRERNTESVCLATLTAVLLGLGSSPGEGMDVCKCILPSQHVGTIKSRRAANPLLKLVEREERLEAPDHPQGSTKILSSSIDSPKAPSTSRASTKTPSSFRFRELKKFEVY